MKISKIIVTASVAVFCFVTAVFADVLVNEENFPDENFRNWILEQSWGSDGVITDAEIAEITHIGVIRKNIYSLKGIEYFTALRELDVTGNQLTELDVSKNTALEWLGVVNNQLTELDVSNNTALTVLGVAYNRLTELDVSKNTALEWLGVYYNQLAKLDVSKNTALTELYVWNNQLTELDVSKNTALTKLWVSYNKLVEFNVSKNTALTSLGVSDNQLTKLDVSKNTALTSLGVSDNQLTKLDVSKNTALIVLEAVGNQLTELDVSKNIALEWLLVNNNQLTELDVSNNTALTVLNVHNNQLTEITVFCGFNLSNLTGVNIDNATVQHYFNWQITTPATYARTGEETEICSSCQAEREKRPIARLPHTINLPQTTVTYDNTPKRFTTIRFVGTTTITLTENEDFTATYTNNINAGTASVRIRGINDYSFIDTTINFTIEKLTINVSWGNTRLEWNDAPQAPTPIGSVERFPLRATAGSFETERNLPGFNYTAHAELVTRDTNIILSGNLQTRFDIVPQRVAVKWDNLGPFVYNRMEQNPKASADIKLRGDVRTLQLLLDNPRTRVGRYTAEARLPQNTIYIGNVLLDESTQDFEITHRPLTPRLLNPRERITTSSGLTKQQLDSILTIAIDFDNFARDTITNEADDKRVLQGSVRFDIQNDNSQNSLRSQALTSGEHIVTISGESQNYTILERKIAITIGERFLIVENYPRTTAIIDTEKSGSSHGMKFAINPVSEKAEISVVLPNNERAVETNVVIYDMTGNVVFSAASTASTGSATTATGGAIVWDLRNSAGRLVANGTYLVIAEVRGANGKIYAYSARLGVKR